MDRQARATVQVGQPVTVCCAEGEVGTVYDGALKFIRQTLDVGNLPRPHTKIMLNVGNPDQAFSLSFLPNDGVGLAREEFIITSTIQVHPLALVHFDTLPAGPAKDKITQLTRAYAHKPEYFVDRLAERVGQIAAAFYPKDVIVRLSDFKTNEYAGLLGGEGFEPHEENPMIGFRGASRYYDSRYREGFLLECRAMKKVREAMGLTNVKLMIPFCRTVDEGKKVLAVMAEAGLQRGHKGLEIYVMCEIPANVILAEEFAEIFDGFSIGSNDLTQLATDIAFALGVLALLGNRVPLALKVFLTPLAIADDLLAVLVIALFYTSTISWGNLAIGGVFFMLLVAANAAGLRHPLVYGVLGIGGLWLAFLLSGIHATIAGVLAAMTIPARTRITGSEFLSRGKGLLGRFEKAMSLETPPLADRERHQIAHHMEIAVQHAATPLQRLEHALQPWVTVVVMPVFALANAGITLDAQIGGMLISPVALGIIFGLLVGKPVGIVLSSWLVIRGGLTTLPAGVSWSHLWAVGCLAGIGFTMSLFITGLAFAHASSLMSAKVGILVASMTAGTIGWLLLKRTQLA